MNYAAIYTSLMEYRKKDVTETGEVHHILPKCLGGDDSSSNLVRLTYREHYIAHRLLTKIYPENHNLKYAVYMMTLVQSSEERQPTSRQVAVGRQNLSEAAKIRSEWFNPGKTEKSRSAARKRMIENNPIAKKPWTNHTAHPVVVTYTDGTTQMFECASLIPIPYQTVKWMRRHGKGSKKHNIVSIERANKDENKS